MLGANTRYRPEQPKRRTKKTGISMDTETMTRVLDGIGAMFGI